MQTFFCDEDYESYITLMAQSCKAENVEIRAYRLIPNHVHGMRKGEERRTRIATGARAATPRWLPVTALFCQR
jgi:hypothetical protein